MNIQFMRKGDFADPQQQRALRSMKLSIGGVAFILLLSVVTGYFLKLVVIVGLLALGFLGAKLKRLHSILSVRQFKWIESCNDYELFCLLNDPLTQQTDRNELIDILELIGRDLKSDNGTIYFV
ncbi:hypothetical protein [Vibrio sp. WXL210]|uniref:hypothetical protein n=1 Tax=Vibrio sp. WXL210 TaxID=3450709 RepID=UPI003EC7AD00